MGIAPSTPHDTDEVGTAVLTRFPGGHPFWPEGAEVTWGTRVFLCTRSTGGPSDPPFTVGVYPLTAEGRRFPVSYIDGAEPITMVDFHTVEALVEWLDDLTEGHDDPQRCARAVMVAYEQIVRANNSPEWDTIKAVADCDLGLWGALGETWDMANDLGIDLDVDKGEGHPDGIGDDGQALRDALQDLLEDELQPRLARELIPTLPQIVAAMIADIRADIADGLVPADVSSFSELHDHVDANMYGARVTCRDAESGDCTPRLPHALDLAVLNMAQEIVDSWLDGGDRD